MKAGLAGMGDDCCFFGLETGGALMRASEAMGAAKMLQVVS
jgi:hypothetical protein